MDGLEGLEGLGVLVPRPGAASDRPLDADDGFSAAERPRPLLERLSWRLFAGCVCPAGEEALAGSEGGFTTTLSGLPRPVTFWKNFAIKIRLPVNLFKIWTDYTPLPASCWCQSQGNNPALKGP